uniref:Oxidoreductase n=1 Tax=Solanum tuberosum TaxID=4113 RepID=M1AUX9_SOLTU
MALIIQNPFLFSTKLSQSRGLLHCFSAVSQKPLRYAVLGAGFAGLSVAWHLLQQSSEESNLCIDIYDEVGIGGGASGMSGGLLHPYSPKVKLLWRGEECWKESLKLLNVAEDARSSKSLDMVMPKTGLKEGDFIVRRSGLVRPVLSVKNMHMMNDVSASNYYMQQETYM